MKVYLEPQAWMSRGIKRVATALKRYKPREVKIVAQRDKADLEIVHMVGCGSIPEYMGQDRPYAVVQYCFATTEVGPSLDYWLPIWQRSRAVWSYYDLPGNGYKKLYQPLGVDPAVFYERNNNADGREYVIATHGYVAETEGVHECHRAAGRVEHRAAHLGPDLGQGGDTFSDLAEEDVAALWSRSERVAALRRVEGFELPGFEGLLCGARPVAFDAPHYRAWYGTHADYVPECAPLVLTRLLAELLATAPRAVTKKERAEVAELCSWPRLTRSFWEAIL